MIFPGLPEGDNSVTLEVDGLTFASRTVSARFSVPLHIDTRAAYQDSRSSQEVLRSGSGEAAITIHSITRTPMAVLVEGTFDGLSEGAIQSIRHPDVWLVDSTGARVLTDSGRLGFGDGDRRFQFYFPAVQPGPARLEFARFPASPAPTMEIVVP